MSDLCRFETRRTAVRRAGLALLCGALVSAAQAAPQRVERFEAPTWQRLQATLARPTAVVFTTTDCSYCPAVVRDVGAALARGRLRDARAELVAVVMDVAPGEADAALLADAHYRPADRLYAFAGQPAALRHAVQPRWRGITPAVALLAPGVAPRWIVGAPSAAEIEAWAEEAAARRR